MVTLDLLELLANRDLLVPVDLLVLLELMVARESLVLLDLLVLLDTRALLACPESVALLELPDPRVRRVRLDSEDLRVM